MSLAGSYCSFTLFLVLAIACSIVSHHASVHKDYGVGIVLAVVSFLITFGCGVFIGTL